MVIIKVKRQEELKQSLLKMKTRKIRLLARRVFDKESVEALDIVAALVHLGANATELKIGRKDVFCEAIDICRKHFISLPVNKIFKILTVYYRNYSRSLTNPDIQLRFGFDIANILFGTRRGNIEQAVVVMGKVANLCRIQGCNFDKAFESEEMEQESMLLILFSIIALSNITHTWENLIAGAFSNPEHKQLLKKLLVIFYGLGVNNIQFINQVEWNKENFVGIGLPNNAVFAINPVPGASIPVPVKYLFFMRQLNQSVVDKINEQQQELFDVISWFDGYSMSLSDHFSLMWSEIKNELKYGIRTNGLDVVNMDILGFKNVGYTKLQLIKEGAVFPDINAKYWLDNNDSMSSINILLQDKPLAEYVSPHFEPDDPRVIVDMLLVYMAVHCYWRIVTGKKFSPPKLSLRKQSSEKKAGGKRDVVSGVVRPFYRPLPAGHEPSLRALQGAWVTFQDVPPSGYTFVQEHRRGYDEVLEAKPVFSYTEEKLGFVSD